MSDPGTYTVNHSHLAAFLSYSGLGLMEVSKEGKTLLFEFSDPNNDGEQLQEDFFNGRAVADGRALLKENQEIQHEIWKAKAKQEKA